MPSDDVLEPAEAVVATLLDNHRTFLRYLERRTGDRALAEDILQDAFVKAIAKPTQLPEHDGSVQWFYRVLRNAAIDRFRRTKATERQAEAFQQELENHVEPTAEAHSEICECVVRLAQTLKPEYAEALQAIEVMEKPVKAYAAEAGISASNAGVRIFRAREALKRRVKESCGTCATHGCLDCSCQSNRRDRSGP